MTQLSTKDHRRDSAGLTYVYPVLSRRSAGLSIGINVNTNNACNWRCIYCQVPNLSIGSAPDLDFALLESELTEFLKDVQSGAFYERFDISVEQQMIKDIAISGNGEPTSVKEFARLVELIGHVATRFEILPTSKLVLITNGSLIHLPHVKQGLQTFHRWGGEVWFKLDSATREGRQTINHAQQSQRQLLENLRLAVHLGKTKIQTCLVDFAGAAWSASEQNAYLDLLSSLSDLPYRPEIRLYTLARPSLQPEAEQLRPIPLETMQRFAEEIGNLGYKVSISA